jgi:hypothetical protein
VAWQAPKTLAMEGPAAAEAARPPVQATQQPATQFLRQLSLIKAGHEAAAAAGPKAVQQQLLSTAALRHALTQLQWQSVED